MMKDNNFVSVARFAEIVGVSRQTINKATSNKLKEYVRQDGNKKVISLEALKLYDLQSVDSECKQGLQGVDNEVYKNRGQVDNSVNQKCKLVNQNDPDFVNSVNHVNPKCKLVNPKTAEVYNQVDKINSELIEILRAEIEELHKQLEVKDRQIDALNNQITDHQSQLKIQSQLLYNSQCLQLQGQTENKNTGKETTTEQRKKSFWNRLFK